MLISGLGGSVTRFYVHASILVGRHNPSVADQAKLGYAVAMKILRTTLVVIALVHLVMGYLFLTQQLRIASYYGFEQIDTLHAYFFMMVGTSMLAIAVASFFAFLKPLKNSGIILLLIFIHFSFFVGDVVIFSWGFLPIMKLLPEMVLSVALCVVLIRFFPKDGKDEEPVLSAEDLFPELEEEPEEDQPAISS